MMRKLFLYHFFVKVSALFCLLLIVLSCKQSQRKIKYVDDIAFSMEVDNKYFSVCTSRPYQYFNDSKGGISYVGEKVALIDEIRSKYNSEKVSKENGMIRIRFIVNCHGETGRFRLMAIDNQYNSKQFDKNITDQLLSITKALNGWKTKSINGHNIDYYQYLIFVIQDGQIINILP